MLCEIKRATLTEDELLNFKAELRRVDHDIGINEGFVQHMIEQEAERPDSTPATQSFGLYIAAILKQFRRMINDAQDLLEAGADSPESIRHAQTLIQLTQFHNQEVRLFIIKGKRAREKYLARNN